ETAADVPRGADVPADGRRALMISTDWRTERHAILLAVLSLAVLVLLRPYEPVWPHTYDLHGMSDESVRDLQYRFVHARFNLYFSFEDVFHATPLIERAWAVGFELVGVLALFFAFLRSSAGRTVLAVSLTVVALSLATPNLTALNFSIAQHHSGGL